MNSIIKSITSITTQVNLDSQINTVKTNTLYGIILLFSLLFAKQHIFAQPTIASFTPTSGEIGATVTITGTGFNSTPANNIVFFGATRATVSAATATSLILTVPIGATFAPITVLNTATTLAAYSTKFFNPTFTPNKGSITTADIAEKINFEAGNSSKSVVIGDLDGDSKPDLAIANLSNNTISILRNIGSSGTVNFATKVDFTTGSASLSVAIGDIDGDGKPDLAIANISSNTVSVLRNKCSIGTVSFETKVDFTTGSAPLSVAIGDIDGDGKPDLVTVNNNSNTVSVLPNTSSSGIVSFATKVDFTTGSSPYSLAIGDIDGDYKPDLAITNKNDSSVSILRNIGSIGTINFAAKINFTTGSNPQFVAIGDIDGNDKVDLAIANFNSNTVSVLRNTGSIGTINFATKVDFITGSNPNSVAIGDIDGDGKPDLATANISSANISILRNLGNSSIVSFETKVDFTINGNPQSIATGDIDGDGKPDLTIVNGYNVYILRNNPIPPPPTIISLTPTSGVVGATVSITGTGFNTTPTSNIVFFGATRAIVIAATITNLTVTVPTGATFAPITVLNTSTHLAAYSNQIFSPTFSSNKSNITITDMAAKVDFTASYGPGSVVIGDIDGDGKPDLITANVGNSSNTVSVFRNTSAPGTISFATKVDFAVGTYPESLAIGDIDGDGKPDLAIANRGSNTLSVLRNTSRSGMVSFATKVNFETGSEPLSIAIGDINGDGKPDLATANQFSISGTVSVLRNTSILGTVNFASKVDFETGSDSRFVAIGDIDGDGKPDLATANGSANTVSIFRNTYSPDLGIVNFATRVDFTIVQWPVSLAIGDIDGDGKSDLVTTNINSANISVLRNISSSGTVNFAQNIDFETGINPCFLSIGDINGDDKLDLTIPSSHSNAVSVLCNIGNSGTLNFAPKVDFRTGLVPFSSAIGDIDGDGKPDLVTVNDNNNTVSVLRNMSPTTRIDELKTNNQIIIYPNPFNETIHITLLNNLKLEKVLIYDLIGNEIISSDKNAIDASILKSGIYLITIVDNIGNSYNQKLLKN
ncbi:MAG: FG-GAP-like repeat-containing protein [Bacteroidota bacterium]